MAITHEGTNLIGDRLISLLIIMSIAYTVSTFSLNYWFNLSDQISQLMDLSPNKRPFYQRGQKAMILIMSAF